MVPIRQYEPSTLSIDEQIEVFEAASFKGINFVFFRRFSDGRTSRVAAYIGDNSDQRLNEKALTELHLQVWLQGKAPFEGDLVITLRPEGSGTFVEAATIIKGQLFDWGKSKRCHEELFADLKPTPAII